MARLTTERSDWDGQTAPAEESSAVHAANGHAAGEFGLSTFSSLRHRDYRYLWGGVVCMSAGIWIQQVTLGWLAYELSGSALVLGALNGVRALPFLVAGPIAGVAADRMDRRKLMMNSQVVLLVTAFGMAGLVVSGLLEVWHLFAFALLTALPWAFAQTVRQTVLPNVVPRADLMNAIVLNQIGFNMMKVLGPALGGVLIAWFGAGGNFFVQGAAFTLVLWMLFAMRVPPTPLQARQTSVYANLMEGLAYVRSNRVVLGITVAALLPNIFAMPVYTSLMPVFQKDVLHVGPEGLGLLLAAPGAGAVIALMTLAVLSHRVRRRGLVLLAALALLGCSLIAFSQAGSFELAMLALLGVGGFQLLFQSSAQTVIQTIVPDALRGRVMSIYLLDHGLAPAGALLSGVATHFVGAPLTVAVSGMMILALVVVLARGMPEIGRIGVQ